MLVRKSLVAKPPPYTYGFPPSRFGAWRDYQYETVQAVTASIKDDKVVMLTAPTGAGKSPIAVTVAKELDKKAVILVSTKLLARQYTESLSEVAFIIEGRNNYQCGDKPWLTADLAPCTIVPKYDCQAHCAYRVAKSAAKYAPIVITNYPYWLYSQNYTASMERELVILDEAHRAESALMAFVSISLNKQSLEEEHINYPAGAYFSKWQEWAEIHLPIVARQFNTVKELAETFDWQHSYLTRLQRLKALRDNLDKLSKADSTWLITDERQSIRFRPIWVSEHSEALFTRDARIMLMSATLPFARSLGITNYVEIETPSTFPIRNRPFIYDPVISLNHKNIEEGLELIAKRIMALAKMNASYKGLVHVASYRQASLLMSHLPSRFITHGYRDREETLAQFKAAQEPLVLVSPSMHEGVSFDDDFARWQVIAKVQWADRNDPQVAARANEDNEWYVHAACSNIVQTYGRIIRSVADWGTTYCLDGSFGYLYDKNQNYFPKWFRDAVVKRRG